MSGGLTTRINAIASQHIPRGAYDGFFAELVPATRLVIVKGFVKQGMTVDDAEDLTQEAFRRLWEARERLLPDTTGQFFGTICANIMRTYWRATSRKQHRLYALTDRASERLQYAPSPSAADELEHRERLELLARNIERLPPPKRRAVELRLQGRSNEDIALQLGVPIGTVKSRMYHAERSLALMFDGQGYTVKSA